MQNSQLAWNELNGNHFIDQRQSEAYLNIAITKWLPISKNALSRKTRTLSILANILKHNHGDDWLGDFLKEPISFHANKLLQSAIAFNYAGDSQRALRDAIASQALFRHVGNVAGEAWTSFEQVYALHRLSRAKECITELLSSQSHITFGHYRWLTIQFQLEYSGCEAMLSNFDKAQHLASTAIKYALRDGYSILLLRGIGYEASFNTLEGRLSWSRVRNEEGLNLFWKASYPLERGFQFYSDLEYVAEEEEQWFLAAALQREAISMLSGSGRLDIEAIAHFRLAIVNQTNGDMEVANKEFAEGDVLFQKLSPRSSNRFYRAYAEIGLAALEARSGSLDAAIMRLQRIDSATATANNFAITLPYLKAWADVEHHRRHEHAEMNYLKTVIAIGNHGFRNLHSTQHRWQWRREVGQVYRRLLQMEIARPHESDQSLADWEQYRIRETMGRSWTFGAPIGSRAAKETLHLRTNTLITSSLLTFAIFPEATTAWLADNRGVTEVSIPISSSDLQREVNSFRLLCSNPNSAIEKVKAAGSRLYRLLILPFKHTLDRTRTLYIESDEFLSLTPWPALVTEEGAYFTEEQLLVNIPGLFYRTRYKTQRRSMNHMLIAYPGAVTLHGEIYAPLPQADDEVRYISSLYPNAISLRGSQVTLTRLMEQLPQASIFHFAGHAITRDYSGDLILQGSPEGDIFSTQHLAAISLPSMDLVVLSACSTAAADRDIARDPRGLVWGFLNSGARHVVASRWEIDSGTTAVLIQHFYLHLHGGSAPFRSLAQARHILIKQPELSHPYYWSSFDIFGTIH